LTQLANRQNPVGYYRQFATENIGFRRGRLNTSVTFLFGASSASIRAVVSESDQDLLIGD
jgi:hypothetical protein